MSEDGKNSRYRITSIEALEAIYGEPAIASIHKEVNYIHPHYQRFIESAPFAVLATSGADGLDASPRGDIAGFINVLDEKTLLLPDRRGNNRVDSLRNIICDPRVALIFMIPGVGETLRVNGRAEIRVDPDLLAHFSVDGKMPRSVLVIQVDAVFFQCSRAILRSGLWKHDQQIDRSALPSVGTMLEDLSRSGINGAQYDRELPGRLKSSLY